MNAFDKIYTLLTEGELPKKGVRHLFYKPKAPIWHKEKPKPEDPKTPYGLAIRQGQIKQEIVGLKAKKDAALQSAKEKLRKATGKKP